MGDSNPSATPRLTDAPLPPYSYVPGKFPHPVTDSRGHSYGRESPIVKAPHDGDWRSCHEYLRGMDLFNHGYYWEAHESWEAVWIVLGRTGPDADFLKGLIKLAAAGVKAREGRREGVARHAKRALELFNSVALKSPRHAHEAWGLPLSRLIAAATELAAHPEAVLNDSPAPVAIVFPFVLHRA
jgi:hypothetical protein